MDLEHLIELILPPIIGVLEMMGIFVVAVSAVRAFAEYLGNTFLHRHYALQFELADGLATGLEFKMAAEILKTVLVREMSELLILGAVIILRALLSLLIQNAGRVLTREQIMDRIWGYDYGGSSRTLDMHIKTLRQKLGSSGSQIHTIRNVGYRLGDA